MKRKFASRISIILAVLVIVFSLSVLVSCDSNAKITFVLGDGQENVVWALKDPCPFAFVNGVPMPNIDDQKFCGWFVDEGCTQQYEGAFDDSATLYAKWQPYGNFDDVLFEDTFVVYDGFEHTIIPTNLPEDTAVEYNITGCVDAGEYHITATLSKSEYVTKTLSAMLTIEKAQIYGVTFEDDVVEWDGMEHGIFVCGLPNGVSVSYANNNQTNVGVYDVVASFDVGNNYQPIDDMHATLTITQKMLEITFVNGDDETTVLSVGYGEVIFGVPVIYQKDGYIARWSEDLSSVATQNMTVFAQYTAIEYQILLVLGADETNVLSFTVESDDLVLPSPSKNGYTFDGWYKGINLVGDKIEIVPQGSTGNRTYYAKWTLNQYNINYHLGGYGVNDVENPQTFNIECGELTLTPAYCVGMDFVGWYFDEECTQEVGTIDTAQTFSDLDVYAKWDAHLYTVDYILDGGVNDERNPLSYVYGADCVLYSPTREGYVFVGWVDENGRTVDNLNACIGDITLFAIWQAV